MIQADVRYKRRNWEAINYENRSVSMYFVHTKNRFAF